jgi:hypothetical protein
LFEVVETTAVVGMIWWPVEMHRTVVDVVARTDSMAAADRVHTLDNAVDDVVDRPYVVGVDTLADVASESVHCT